ncbi:GGDEF domain-containing protein [Luteibacter aegosomatissinici]|uniref:GGDEF domain-containing protein n=1 Tax=Luteibacter aegosomatissinici TaxID=2911539 RepID=UPI001FF7473E|nr:GGDEF domain-containing protein [Luteibacter aegosomatissinici]UPG95197.1 diguanylate cyclase [Luteibacter aegosomatissinici]
MEQDIWERKYNLALERMERDERDFRAIEESLRRLVLRLSALARGQSEAADRLLDQLGDGLKHAASPAELEPLLDGLAEAVAALDARVAGEAAMREPAETSEPVETAATAAASDDTAAVAALRADVAKLQDLLAEVSGRLGDMTRYLVAELEDATAGNDPGRTLGEQVSEEMRLLAEQTLEASDVTALRDQVTARLAVIDQHFRDYREREDARLATYRERAERMRDRVEELETQATSLQDSLRREHELALTDPLTGLPNRLAYERQMAQLEADVREGRVTACVGAFDIDHFKTINDTFGHAAGDAVLRIVGNTLARALEGRAFVARYGGEEFAVVFAGYSAEDALVVARELCATVEGLAFHASQKPVKVTMSGGLTRFGAEERAATAFDRADRALYAAKRAGRNTCIVL